MYVKIFSPDGEPFEVTEDRAAELRLNHDWTSQPVVDAPKDEIRAVTTRRRRKRGETQAEIGEE